VLNQVAHRAKEGGHDSVGLGRWAYVRLQGRKLKTIGGDDPSGSMMKVNEAVRRPISRDLVVVSAYRPNREGTRESTVWAQHRLYFPESIRQRFWECGLDEAILRRHPPTATHQRNQRNISIDGIFTTSGIPVLAGGYYAFHEFVEADHRALWIDIDTALAHAVATSKITSTCSVVAPLRPLPNGIAAPQPSRRGWICI